MQTLQTSESRLAVMSRISLCLIEGNPPLGHDRAWSTEKFLPQAQVVGVREGCQLYRSARASRKAPLCKLKPNSRIGRVVSQVEAPFSWARSMDLCNEVE